MDKLKRVPRIAESLEVSARTVHAMIDKGMPCFKVGNTIWLNPEQVYEWISKHERKRGPKEFLTT
jgi:hypothetical protein